MGVPLPPEDEKLPEDGKVELSRVVALASDKLLQKGQAGTTTTSSTATRNPDIQMQKQNLLSNKLDLSMTRLWMKQNLT